MSLRHALCALLLGLAITPLPSAGQGYPSKPLELIVHTSAGGGPDRLARFLGELLTREKLVSQPITILNKPGGAGTVAFSHIRMRRGDPHTILTSAGSTLISATLRPELGVSLDEFTFLALLAQDPQAIMVSADAPYRTLKDFTDAAKRDSTGFSASITSPTSSGRMLVWLLEKETGARFRTVSFKSGSEAITAVMGGHTQFSTENISEGMAAVEGKKIRVLAVTSAQRMASVPDAPTLRELGYNVHMGTSRGFAMPAGVPRQSVEQMEALLEKVYHSAAWKNYAQASNFENIWMGSAEFTRYITQRRAAMQDFLHAIGATK